MSQMGESEATLNFRGNLGYATQETGRGQQLLLTY